ncbi:unnamed protein product [Notodromas monacha]|uniref:Protein THEM6 n=1 Tax=Notodromas monacha TaxID=399045 RepID=A0A7R9BIL5_9CRUS|nr:unnamed protein product [Notodromas monacha]CAG0916191.1 unnamed protein product [Notodromas monacha]
MSCWLVALCGFVIFELYYFFRGATTALIGQVRRPLNISDEANLYGICTLNDVDFFGNHMNNARFLRELDFARIDFFVRLGALRIIRAAGNTVWVGASTIRYRKPIYLFSPYRIRTRIAHWDSHDVYLSHRFESLNGFVHAIGYSKLVIPKVEIPELINRASLGPVDIPVPDEALKAWIAYLNSDRQQLYDELGHQPEKSKVNDTNAVAS